MLPDAPAQVVITDTPVPAPHDTNITQLPANPPLTRRVVSPLNGATIPVSPQQAAIARAARAEKLRQQAAQAIALKANGSLRTAWQTVVGAQYERATGFEAHTPAAAFVARAIGAFVEHDAPTQAAPALPVELQALTQFIREQSATHPELTERLARLARGESSTS